MMLHLAKPETNRANLSADSCTFRAVEASVQYEDASDERGDRGAQGV